MELICYATNESIEENLHNKFTSSRGQQRKEEHLTLFHEPLAQPPPYILILRMHMSFHCFNHSTRTMADSLLLTLTCLSDEMGQDGNK